VVPLLVLLSYAIAPLPMDLAFSGGLVLTVVLSVLVLGQIAGDGRSDWLKGAQLLAVHLILGLAFFFAPAAAAGQTIGADDCVGCHPDQGVALATNGGHSPLVDCVGCHAERRPNRVGRGHRAKPRCADCHMEPTGHPPRNVEPTGMRATRNCLRCHDVHGETANLHLVNTTVVFRRRAFPIDYTVPGGAVPGGLVDPLDPGKGLCEVCHTKTDVYRRDGKGEPHFPQDCTLCHSHADHFLPVADASNCNVCHADEAARFDDDPSAHSARFQCVDCHAELSPTPGPGHRAVEACTDCHSDRMTHAPNGPPGLPCTQCHDPHGTKNSYLVLDLLTTTLGNEVPIRFDNLDGKVDGSFASASNPGTGICEVCHTTTRHYRADGTGSPHFTFSCLPCHLHAGGFNPQ